jgi:hypothetical protein
MPQEIRSICKMIIHSFMSSRSMARMGEMLARSRFPLGPFIRIDPTEHAREIQWETDRAQRNGMGGVVSMLVSRAHTLEALFNSLATKAVKKVDKPAVLDIYLRQALRAQSQCRSMLEGGVAEIKNPRPVAFISNRTTQLGISRRTTDRRRKFA